MILLQSEKVCVRYMKKCWFRQEWGMWQSIQSLEDLCLDHTDCLITKAIHEKHTHKEYIGVDACAANLMRPAIYGAYHHITVIGKENEPCDHMYDVTGCSVRELMISLQLTVCSRRSTWEICCVIHDAGAHGFSMGYNYNGRLRSAEVLLKEDGSTQLIRRAETPADYFATFDCFDIADRLPKK